MAKNSILTPRKTPTKRKFSGKARKSKRFKKSKSGKKYYKNLKKLKKYGGRTINVKEDNEFNNVIKRTQKVSRHQQKIINRRFKNGYSPFEKIITDQIGLTGASQYNKCKWIWRSAGLTGFLKEMFDYFPVDTNSVGTSTTTTSNLYVKASEQSVYVNKINLSYEIMNPTNYDVNLIIYDIVYKEDYNGDCTSLTLESYSGSLTSGGNPISLIETGLKSKMAGTNVLVSDPTEIDIDDIKCNPTMSYNFNVFCKIVKKQVFRLQPGATMTHIFKFRPKSLINNGYMAIRYGSQYTYRAVKNISCGCLFKIYGQISGSGDDTNKTEIANAAGRLLLKENLTYKWYTMTPRYNYVFRDKTAEWAPTDETMEVVNDVTIKPIQEINTDPDDNDPGHITVGE